MGAKRATRFWRGNSGARYSISIGADDVRSAALGLFERNPPRGSLRVAAQSLEGAATGNADVEAEYEDALGQKLAPDTSSVLY